MSEGFFTRSRILVGGSAAISAVLVSAYLAAGGASYEPAKVRDPCQPRAWTSPNGIQEIVQQFSLSALDGAACQLGVSREELALALATPDSRRQFADKYGIGDAQLEDAVRAGLDRAIDDAVDAGELNPLIATALHEVVKQIPVDQAIQLINDAAPIFNNVQSLLGNAGDLLNQIEGLIP